MSVNTHFWSMAAMLLVSAVAAVVVCTRLRARLLAMITMRKYTHGFLFLSYMSMGLRLSALLAAEAPLLIPDYVDSYSLELKSERHFDRQSFVMIRRRKL